MAHLRSKQSHRSRTWQRHWKQWKRSAAATGNIRYGVIGTTIICLAWWGLFVLFQSGSDPTQGQMGRNDISTFDETPFIVEHRPARSEPRRFAAPSYPANLTLDVHESSPAPTAVGTMANDAAAFTGRDIQQASFERTASPRAQGAWLTGTIEMDTDTRPLR